MDDSVKEAMEVFRLCDEREKDDRIAFEEDIRFARLEEQWSDAAKRARQGRPMITSNKLASIIRQVVNDARQNKPAITVRPQDNEADVETAEVFSGLVRNIESTSNADIAYDTAVENAVSGGFGYIRVNIEYAHNDTFDKDIVIQRVPNPLAVYGDPESFSADGSDWNVAFVCDQYKRDTFEKKYPKAALVGFEGAELPDNWQEGDNITVAEYWTREQAQKTIVQLSDGMIIGEEEYKAQKALFDQMGLTVEGSRPVMSYKTTQRIITGVEELEKNDWAGCYIPIIPLYGDEVVLKGKRYLRSLIRSAKSAQERYNYWISAMTEMVALAPKVPYIGEQGAFDVDPNWATANTASHAYLQHKKGTQKPERQSGPQVPSGMMQEAMNASEDIKAITGIYDASLGARSNETSGVAINARKREGDVSTFHFIDNETRSIRQVGRVVVDLIPHVYTAGRVARTLGLDGKSEQITLGEEVQKPDGTVKIYDLSVGKYDVAVKAGPSYTTQREETRTELVELARAIGPENASKLVPMYLRSCDWPGAEEAADIIEGKADENAIPPQVQQQMGQMQQIIQQGGQRLQQLEQENQQLKAANEIKAAEVQVKGLEAEAKIIEANAKMWTAQNPPPVVQPQPREAAQPAGNPFAVEGSA